MPKEPAASGKPDARNSSDARSAERQAVREHAAVQDSAVQKQKNVPAGSGNASEDSAGVPEDSADSADGFRESVPVFCRNCCNDP